jgi:hypothetical protein
MIVCNVVEWIEERASSLQYVEVLRKTMEFCQNRT